jgi:hypothetical protein
LPAVRVPNVQNLTQEDSKGLVYSMFEISLPVLPSTGQQQQPPGLRLDVTLPFITQPVADRGLGILARVGVRKYIRIHQCGVDSAGVPSAHYSGHNITGSFCGFQACCGVFSACNAVQSAFQHRVLTRADHLVTLLTPSRDVLCCCVCVCVCSALGQHQLAARSAVQRRWGSGPAFEGA